MIKRVFVLVGLCLFCCGACSSTTEPEWRCVQQVVLDSLGYSPDSTRYWTIGLNECKRQTVLGSLDPVMGSSSEVLFHRESR
jgi:hypothetical protein